MLKIVLREVAPPILRWVWSQARRSRAFQGRYPTWSAAAAAATGYQKADILERTRESLKRAVNIPGAFAQDGKIFHASEPRLPLLTGLLLAAARANGRLSVLDFGGALGNTYFQHRDFLRGLAELRWQVVEQENHVRCGREEFADGTLSFFATIAEGAKAERPNAVVLSSVLQYLPEPYAVLDELLALRPEVVVVDRTPFAVAGEEFLTVQKVDPTIYEASYPAWVFEERKLVEKFRNAYETYVAYTCDDDLDPAAVYKGFVFVRKP